MERFFVLDKYNTWYDWGLILTSKSVTPPEPKTSYIEIDGMSGSLDLTEALTGEVVYKDRTVTATFWTDNGTRKEREKLLRDITTALHGKKIKVIEPDEPYKYFYGRLTIKSVNNILPYLEFTIEITCEPWRYSLEETKRVITVVGDTNIGAVLNNSGVKSLIPTITVEGAISLKYEGITTVALTDGTYKIPDIKLKQGYTVIGVSGTGSVTFAYREADL